jgi:hypothetical protein
VCLPYEYCLTGNYSVRRIKSSVCELTTEHYTKLEGVFGHAACFINFNTRWSYILGRGQCGLPAPLELHVKWISVQDSAILVYSVINSTSCFLSFPVENFVLLV